MTRILITGADGFLGKNLQLHCAARPDIEVVTYTRNDRPESLSEKLQGVGMVFHLAGVNRAAEASEFASGNVEVTRQLTSALAQLAENTGTRIPVVYSSSTQAALDNVYGNSKREAEQLLFSLANTHALPVFIFRLPNLFGKWGKSNYNSVVATFCHNTARGLPVVIHDPAAPLTLVYIDDLLAQFMDILDGKIAAPSAGQYVDVTTTYHLTVGELSERLQRFRDCRTSLEIADVGRGLGRALYATYVSYLPVESFAYEVPAHRDPRGVFVEMLKTPDTGQFSFFTAHPGVTRGGHYHRSKTEKFLVITGQARFRFRHMQTGQTHELFTNGETPQIVETVPGWTHDITNVGSSEMVVMLWANEIFDREAPDTFSCPL